MKIHLFSVDLKLVSQRDPSRRSFRVLEFNDGLSSGFSGFNSLGEEKMISGRVAADYRRLFPQYQVMDLGDEKPARDGRPILMIPRSSNTVTWMGRSDYIAAQRMQGVLESINSDLHLSAFGRNKGYQHFLAEKMGGDAATLFPETKLLPTLFKQALPQIREMPESDTGYVLKPLDLFGGTGIKLIDQKDLMPVLQADLRQRHSLLQKPWIGIVEPSCQLQSRVPANEVVTKDGIYDGTMRVAFTVYENDDGNMHCQVHEAYWKLPEKTIEDRQGPHSVVSYSPSNLDQRRAKPKISFEGSLKAFFDIAGCDTNKILSAPVDADVKSWLFPALSDKLAAYFSFVNKTNHLANVIELIEHEQVGHRGLGWMMAVPTELYPSASEEIDFHYPKDLVNAISNNLLLSNRNDALYDRVTRHVRNLGVNYSINCEDQYTEFKQPLASAISDGMMWAAVGSLLDTVQKLQLP